MNEQQLQEMINSYKVRLFDANETLAATEHQRAQFQQALVKIADIVNLQGENVQLQNLIDAVAALVPVTEDTPTNDEQLLVEAQPTE